MINYPIEFIEKCKRIYPDYERLHELLEQGNVYAGRYLDDGRYGAISVTEVLTASTLSELQEKANAIKEKQELYTEWSEIYKKNNFEA